MAVKISIEQLVMGNVGATGVVIVAMNGLNDAHVVLAADAERVHGRFKHVCWHGGTCDR